MKTRLVNLALQIERLVQEMIECLKRSTEAYNTAELAADRYRTFDELTSRLGLGFLPSVAYSDWRRTGCPGIRPVMIEFYLTLQKIAEERLYLEELYLPQGRDWKTNNDIERNRSKWIVMWNGQNIALKVLHW
jgi:hypothetical protein